MILISKKIKVEMLKKLLKIRFFEETTIKLGQQGKIGGDWDYDMLPASVHFWENIEIFYWLYRYEYNGWINFDICPFREDSIKSSMLSIKHIKKIVDFVKKINIKTFDKLIANNDAVATQEYLWDMLF